MDEQWQNEQDDREQQQDNEQEHELWLADPKAQQEYAQYLKDTKREQTRTIQPTQAPF